MSLNNAINFKDLEVIGNIPIQNIASGVGASSSTFLRGDNTWATPSGTGGGGGINNIVEDTTPQLGGQLDVNGFSLGNGTNELLSFSETASAINEITITNAAIGGSPSITATGDDTDIDLTLDGKGTGVVKTLSSNIDITGNIIVSGTVDGRDIGADGTKLDTVETNADVTDATNVAAAGAVMDGDFSSNGLMERTGAGSYDTATQGVDYYAPGGTDVAIVDGGTGQSTAQAAINALSQVAGATNEFVLTKDTATGDATWKISTVSGVGVALQSATVAHLSGLSPYNGQHIELLGYNTSGDNGGQDLIYRSSGKSSVNIDNGFYFAGGGADDYYESVDKILLRIDRFGATTTDCSTALQQCIDTAQNESGKTILVPNGDWNCQNNIYLYGSGVNLIGEPSSNIIINTNLSSADGNDNAIVIGTSAKGGTSNVWNNAKIAGVGFKTTVDTNELHNFLSLLSVKKISIYNCTFDFSAEDTADQNTTTAIGGYTDETWLSGNYSRSDINIYNNTIIANQDNTGGEGIGLEDADNINVANNSIVGFADDWCGLHNCTDCTVTNNVGESVTGGISFDDTRRVVLGQNMIKRIPDYNSIYYGTSLISCEISTSGTNQAPGEVIISENVCHFPSGVTIPTNIIYLRGVQGASINNNTIINDSVSGIADILAEPDTTASWTGPVGNPDEATGGTSRPRDIIIKGNIVRGVNTSSIIGLSGTAADIIGPVIIEGNIGNIYQENGVDNLIIQDNWEN